MSTRILLLAALAARCLASAQPAVHGPVSFLRPDRAGNGDRIGESVAIDGDWMIAGAPAPGGGGNPSKEGFAAIYRRTPSGWVEDAILESPPSDGEDYFGWTVSISGQRAAVSSNLLDWNGSNTGGVRVYERVDGAWRFESLLTADETGRAHLAEFGRGMALSGDWLVAGCPRDDDHGTQSGSAYIFRRTGAGWTQWAKLTSPSPRGGVEFGHAVAMDGDLLAVGEGSPPSVGTRAVAVYKRGEDDVWILDAMLDMPVEDPLGPSLAALSIHGRRLLSGVGSDRGGLGSAFLFERGESGWSMLRSFHMPEGWGDTAIPHPDFGNNLALSQGVAVVGARFADAGAANAGLAIASLEANDWAAVTLTQPTAIPEPEASFGWGVAANGSWLAVGANVLPNGAVRRVGGVWLYWIGEAPRLEARRLETGPVELSWAAPAPDWRLEAKSSTPEAQWEPVMAEAVQIDGRLTLPLEPSSPFVFYRMALH